MAVLKLTSLVSSIQGKVNGSLFGNTGSTKYIRNKTTPVNKVSPAQGRQRQFITTLTQFWRKLSANERLLWSAFAQNQEVTNRLADKITLSGFNWFVKLNSNLFTVNGALMTVPPLKLVQKFANINLVVGAHSSQAVLVIVDEGIPIGYTYAFFATPTLSIGVKAKANQFKHIQSDSLVGRNVFIFNNAYIDVFGRIGAVGGAIWFYVKVIHNVTGASSVSTPVKGIVVPS